MHVSTLDASFWHVSRLTHMSLQWSHKEKKYLIEEKEDDLLPALMPPPVVKFEL